MTERKYEAGLFRRYVATAGAEWHDHTDDNRVTNWYEYDRDWLAELELDTMHKVQELILSEHRAILKRFAEEEELK